MRAHGIPLEGLDGGSCRVLIVQADADHELIETMRGWGPYEIRSARNGFEAGVVAEQFRPHVIVLDVRADPDEAEAICDNIRQSADLQAMKVIAAGAEEAPLRGRFDAVLPRPYSPVQLVEAIEKVTNLIG